MEKITKTISIEYEYEFYHPRWDNEEKTQLVVFVRDTKERDERGKIQPLKLTFDLKKYQEWNRVRNRSVYIKPDPEETAEEFFAKFKVIADVEYQQSRKREIEFLLNFAANKHKDFISQWLEDGRTQKNTKKETNQSKGANKKKEAKPKKTDASK